MQDTVLSNPMQFISFQSYAVYRFICASCNACYIRETKCHLKLGPESSSYKIVVGNLVTQNEVAIPGY